MRRVYLDNNATTPLLPEVFEAMRPYFAEHFGNASSIHHHGQETRAAVERARESVAALLGCRASEVVFTSGGTEADNLAISGLTRTGDHVISSTIEHHAVLNSCRHREAMGCEVTYIPVDHRGLIDPDDVRRALRPQTKLITIMMANNETGVLQPVEEIGKIAAEADVYFQPTRYKRQGRSPSRSTVSGAICSRSPGINCTLRKEWARFMWARELSCSRCFMAEATNDHGARAQKTYPELSVSARPRNWREKPWSEAISHACQQCAITSKREFCPR